MRTRSLSIGLVYDDSLDRYSGVSHYVRVLGAALVERGHRVHYLVGETHASSLGAAQVYSLARNVPVRFNGNALSMPLVTHRKAIRNALRDAACDVVHVQLPYSPLMAGRVIAALEPRTALVGTFHITSDRAIPQVGARLHGWVSYRAARRFDEVVSVSGSAAATAARYFGLPRTRIVPNMVELTRLREAGVAVRRDRSRDLHARPLDVVYLGALVKRKRVDCLIGALAILRACGLAASLTIAGEGPERRRLEEQVKAERLGDTVRFLGCVSDHDKVAVLGSADVACFPAAFGESFGVVLIEAAAAGAGVVVGGRNAGFTDVLGGCGELCESSSVDIARCLRRLAGDESLRHTIHLAQQRMVASYDVAQITGVLTDVYEDAIARRRTREHRRASNPLPAFGLR